MRTKLSMDIKDSFRKAPFSWQLDSKSKAAFSNVSGVVWMLPYIKFSKVYEISISFVIAEHKQLKVSWNTIGSSVLFTTLGGGSAYLHSFTLHIRDEHWKISGNGDHIRHICRHSVSIERNNHLTLNSTTSCRWTFSVSLYFSLTIVCYKSKRVSFISPGCLETANNQLT